MSQQLIDYVQRDGYLLDPFSTIRNIHHFEVPLKSLRCFVDIELVKGMSLFEYFAVYCANKTIGVKNNGIQKPREINSIT